MEGSVRLPRTWAPGCCGGIGAWLLVLRQSFSRKQKQIAQQNKMHAVGLFQETPGHQSCSSWGGESRRQLSLLLSPPATEQNKSLQGLLITHCCLELQSPCCLDTELLAFPCDPKQESPKTSSFPPSPLCSAWDVVTRGPRRDPAPAAVARTEPCLICSFPFFPVFSCTATVPEAQCSLTLAVLICF